MIDLGHLFITDGNATDGRKGFGHQRGVGNVKDDNNAQNKTSFQDVSVVKTGPGPDQNDND